MHLPRAIKGLESYLDHPSPGGQPTRLSREFHMLDGSGVRGQNRLTVADLVALLLTIHADPEFDAFKQLLAQPQKRGSTINPHFRALKGRMFAKTGTRETDVKVDGAKALAGFVLPRALGGKTLLFAIVCNHANTIGGTAEAFAKIERIVNTEVDLVDAP
jgi:D-alanyl-D-alanine carboxypeptidase